MVRTRRPLAAGSRALPAILRWLRGRGLDVDGAVARLGLPPGAEQAEEAPVSPPEFEGLIAWAAGALGDPLLAVHLPELLPWSSDPAGTPGARASSTLREAFERVARYAPLLHAPLRVACEERGDEFLVLHHLSGAAQRGLRFTNEYALASMLVHARRIVGSAVSPRRVWFAHPAPEEIGELRAFFGTIDVEFERPQGGMAFLAEQAALSTPGGDARPPTPAGRLGGRFPGDAPAEADFVGLLAGRLRQWLTAGALGSAGPVTAIEVARRLRMGTRTLQRRLEQQGTSFKEVLDRVRADLARAYLLDRALPLGEVAYRVGFSDPSTFSRAFKRWTGRSPRDYRDHPIP